MLPPYPLTWPAGRRRRATPESTKTAVSLASARDHLLKQMDALGAKIIVISSNAALRKDGLPSARQPKLGDMGVAVWFKWTLTSEWLCISCDLYDSIAGNIRAIGLSVAEIRGFTNRLAIPMYATIGELFSCKPPPVEQKPPPKQEKQPPPPHKWPEGDWRNVLQIVGKVVTYSQVQTNYRRLAKQYHPDKPGGSTIKFQELQEAYEKAKKHFGFK
ncbi:J domain-containing protein [Spirosoma sp.]|uniref:J domain-containing protein n=1 Tax=Spirosoma sp. TaxID=1899569 RepID=UPI002616B819|nr:J domain-containing protein [Spirosoma sp.]MCX6217649.1 J domain-containing protein [Spirosoma sp.]